MFLDELRSKYENWLSVSQSETWKDLETKAKAEENRLLERLRNVDEWQKVRFIQGQLAAWQKLCNLLKEPETNYNNSIDTQ